MFSAPRRRSALSTGLATLIVVFSSCSGDRTSDGASASTTTTVDEMRDLEATTTTAIAETTVPSVAVGPGFTLEGSTYHGVPVLGTGAVRGSGCGSGIDGDPLVPDVLPDGLWFGSLGPHYEYYEPTSPDDVGYGYARLFDDRLEIDLWCVYAGVVAERKYNDPTCLDDESCPSSNAPWWFTEDRSDTLRSVPLAPGHRYSAEPEIGDPFFPGCSATEPFVANGAWRNWPVWIAVNDGEVTEVLGICSYYTDIRGL